MTDGRFWTVHAALINAAMVKIQNALGAVDSDIRGGVAPVLAPPIGSVK